jgi:hypothetical protein
MVGEGKNEGGGLFVCLLEKEGCKSEINKNDINIGLFVALFRCRPLGQIVRYSRELWGAGDLYQSRWAAP